ncbi:MAG TPA: nucleotide-binding protein [Methanoregula sp.]|nr:nucleotide-binding protein [Methanoregula sp.]
MKVILDANALMMPAQFRIDLFDELRQLVGAFEPVVLSGVVHELSGLSRAKGRDGAAAKCGLALSDRCSVVESGDLRSGSVDEQLVEYAVRNGCLVVTNDRRVRETLLAQGIGVISMRGQKKLEILRR